MPHPIPSALRVVAVGLLVLVVVLVLYVLTIGPVGASPDDTHSAGVPIERFERRFAPVCYCVEKCPAIGRPLNWFIEACDRDGIRFEFDDLESGEVLFCREYR